MIPVRKLRNLPLSQGKRKTAKIFEEAGRKFISNTLAEDEIHYLTEVLDYWIKFDPQDFSSDENQTGEIQNVLISIKESLTKKQETARSLEIAKYIFLKELGKYPSEWDFDAADTGGLDPAKRKVIKGMQVYLEDIRSPYNVGAMFRTAESFGVEKIYLSPFCADPNHTRALRSSMGCVPVMPWSRTEKHSFDKNTFPPGSEFFALETGGIEITKFKFPASAIMIVGSEELGVSPDALAVADSSLGRVSIPIYGAKGSLNAAVAFGIVMQAWGHVCMGS